MRVFLVGTLLLLVATVHVANAPLAAACSCVGFSDDEAYARADVVFVGDVSDYATPEPPTSSLDPALWTFAVTGVYKGEVGRQQVVASVISGASCGLELPHEGRMLVFARREPQPLEPRVEGAALYAGLCDGTRELAIGPVPSTFGAVRAPASATELPAQPRAPSATSSAWMIAAAAVVLVVFLAVLVLRRRQARNGPSSNASA